MQLILSSLQLSLLRYIEFIAFVIEFIALVGFLTITACHNRPKFGGKLWCQLNLENNHEFANPNIIKKTTLFVACLLVSRVHNVEREGEW